MSIKALQEYTRVAKYARYNECKNRRETWREQVDRVIGMHITHLGDRYDALKDDIEFVREMMYNKRILGSQRALQFGGIAILNKNARIYNCAFAHLDRVDFFKELMYLCLCGVGCGFSVQQHHISRLPKITSRNPSDIIKYTIDDSIEGWSDAIDILVRSYFVGNDVTGKVIEFDYSSIRPAGALIKSSGSKAPGPDGLHRSLDKIQELLDSVTVGIDAPIAMRSIVAYDIVMHASDAVVSGGIRRAATICIFSHDDAEMLSAKTGNWFTENPQRGRSNNSAMLIRDEISKDEFYNIFESVKQFGEPGFIFADDREAGFNPCVEIGLYPRHDVTDESGWCFCNLCEINMKKAKTREEFMNACRAAAILGTIQASYTEFPYLGPVTEYIVRREALLGVSMTGMMDTPDIAFDPQIQMDGADLVKETNRRIADIIGINPAARTTCVKPAGSTSCILGSSSGIHPHHSRRYFRRVQANSLETPLQFFKLYNPKAVDKSVWDSNGKTEVITFLCEVPESAKTKVQIGALELLDYVKLTQSNWVTQGTDESLCVKKWLRHNVSNTINIKDREWDTVRDYIYDNRQYFAGISLLPISGDKDYPQAPFTAVYTPDEIVDRYGDASMMASGIIVDALRAFDDDLWKACACACGFNQAELEVPDATRLCKMKPKAIRDIADKVIDRNDWIRRAKKFAKNYFTSTEFPDGDIRRMTYLLKDVHNWKMWCDLKREYQDVPWEDLEESSDTTKLGETVACAGGKCDTSLEV